ncbi:MAG: DsrE family protein [Gemmatimonadetes bacterium]|nr:DsrE family protein [Gemmatimonadota bacterium]
MRSLAAVVVSLLIPTLLSAQERPAGEVIQHPNSTYASVPGMDFPGDADATYRFAWSLVAAADSAHQITPGFRAPARVLNALADDGVPAEQVHLALVAQGPSAVAMLDDDAYREIHGVDNPNLALLRELHENGVELVVCGQTMVGRDLERGDFPDFVKVSRAATAARVILAGRGYVFNPF